MALLIGNETKEATTKSVTKELAYACKFKAAASGTVEEIKLWSKGLTTKTELDVGIYDEGAGKPGVLKAHVKAAGAEPGKEEIVTASGFAVSVTAGTTYWLAFVPATQSVTAYYKKEAGKEDVLKDTTPTKSPELTEGKGWPTKEAESTALSIWALGTETAGSVKGKASGALILGGAAKGSTAEVLAGKASGTLTLSGTGTGAAANRVAGQAAGALTFAGAAKGATASVVQGKAAGPLLLAGTATGSAAGGVTGKASGVLTLTGSAVGSASAVVSATAAGALLLTGTAAGATAEVLEGNAAGTLYLRGKARGSAKGEGGEAKKVILFVFDE